jgi:hypothetical protein
MCQFDQLSRWPEHEGLGVTGLTAEWVADGKVLSLIRSMLTAGALVDGVFESALDRQPRRCSATACSTSSTGSWTGAAQLRLLRRRWARLRPQSAGERVMARITYYVEQRLKLRVNRENRWWPGRCGDPF